jgi:ABC-2 type transport system ATP-binding protein
MKERTQMPVPSLQFERVVKSYGKKIVLSEISFHLDEGECVGLVGVNGAGKTTLIKCLLDFCAIDSGSIRIFGMDHRQAASRKRLTFLPEKFTPPYYLTGGDYLRYMAELNAVPYAMDNIHELLTILDLEYSALSKPVRQFSKGMGQKLGLVACLSSEKDLLIFDEPMNGLDPRARARLRQHLLDLRQKGRTLFYSTQLLEDIEALCNRVAILHEGEIQFLGTPQESYRKFNSADLEQAYLTCVESRVGSIPGQNP